MNRLQTHCGILASGLCAAIQAVEASIQSARVLRDEATPASDDKADFRYVAASLDRAAEALKDARYALGLPDTDKP